MKPMSTEKSTAATFAQTAAKGVLFPAVNGAAMILVLRWMAGQPVTEPFALVPFTHPTKYLPWLVGNSVVHVATTQLCVGVVVMVAVVAVVIAFVIRSGDDPDVPHWTVDATRIFGTLGTILSAFLLGVALASGAGVYAAVCLAVAGMAWCVVELDAARADDKNTICDRTNKEL